MSLLVVVQPRLLPHDLPSWPTVYYYFRCWRIAGLWQQMNQTLRQKVRSSRGREATPSAAIADSQSVKTTEVAQAVGYDGGKLVKGHKRHILVDTLGLLLQVVVGAANVSEKALCEAAIGKDKGSIPSTTKDFRGWRLRRQRFHCRRQRGLSVGLGSR